MSDRLKRTERMIAIWTLLAANPSGYTVKELAEKQEVNIRTIYRDLESLGLDLHIPVYNDKARWKIDDRRMLPPIRFTLVEALNIFLAARLMLGYSCRYDPNIDATFTKLSSVLPDALAIQVRKTMDWMQRLKKDERYLQILATIAESWLSQRRLRIVYRSLMADKGVERIIEPYFIEPAAPGHASYVIGYCHLKKAIRTFKIERIESARLTDEQYVIPADFDANEFFGSSWGIVVEGEVKTIKIRILDPDIMRIMEETVWHPSQVLEMQKDGSMIMTLRVTDTVDLYSWILGWGERMEVIEPAEIRREIVQTAKAMLRVYKGKAV
ncbi:MAG: WYL domain-containing protein [Dehalococcoidales bacterium]|nr:WYL domain-containing protein [Dehalococcoidales bacterium]